MTLNKGFHFYTFGLLKKSYDWVLSWAHKKYSSAASHFEFVNTSQCNSVRFSNILMSFLDNSIKGKFLQH